MSLDNLDRRIDKMLAAQLQQGPGPQENTFKFHLFTPAEQEKIRSLLAGVSLNVTSDSTGRLNLSELTDQELSELESWCLLEQSRTAAL